MRSISKWLIAGAALGGAAMLATPAEAQMDFSIGIGAPTYYGYNWDRTCDWYRWHEMPAPARCLGYYRDVWGPGVYLNSGFVFRDRDHWGRWRDRDDFRHWRGYDWHHRWDHYRDHDHHYRDRDRDWR